MLEVPVAGGSLHVAEWGSGPVVLAIHGITASHKQWPGVAERVQSSVRLVAPDLRGRGASNGLPGPFNIRAHADDMIALLDHLGVPSAAVVGHSMGAYVAQVMATEYPDRVTRLVLIDAGPSPAVEAGIDVDERMHAVLGPAVARLSQTYPSREAYRDQWKQHPALSGPGIWNDVIEAYVDYDLEGEEPELRSRTSGDAVWGDGGDTLVPDGPTAAFLKLRCPVVVMRAERGMFDNPERVVPDEVLEYVRPHVPQMEDELVPGSNHYTIVFAEPGLSRVAARILEAAQQ